MQNRTTVIRFDLRLFSRIVGITLVCCSVFFSAYSALGQNVARDRFAIDVINLKSKKQIRGIVLNPAGNDDLRIVVSREWLQKNDRALCKTLDEQASQELRVSRTELRDRIANWKATGKNAGLDFHMQSELERAEKMVQELDNPPAAVQAPQFHIVTVKRPLVASYFLSNQANHNIAMWGWSSGIPLIETSSPAEITRELKKQNIDPSQPAPEISDHLAPGRDTDDQWDIRMAIVSQGLGESISFQGSGDLMIRVGAETADANVNAIMGQLMQSQVDALLKELSGQSKKSSTKDGIPAWAKAAITQADKIPATHFRATQVDLDPLGERATVESIFMVKLASGQWKLVWRASADESPAEQKEDAIKRIANDPQIIAIKEQFSDNAGAAQSLDRAIRFGAATDSALNTVNDEYMQFVSKFLKHLDYPRF
jgi:hypothetical protein